MTETSALDLWHILKKRKVGIERWLEENNINSFESLLLFKNQQKNNWFINEEMLVLVKEFFHKDVEKTVQSNSIIQDLVKDPQEAQQSIHLEELKDCTSEEFTASNKASIGETLQNKTETSLSEELSNVDGIEENSEENNKKKKRIPNSLK